jgi:hypothetical protein
MKTDKIEDWFPSKTKVACFQYFRFEKEQKKYYIKENPTNYFGCCPEELISI